MSRSILKTSDRNRLIPIPANEGNTDPDYETLNKVKPWSSVDDEPLMMNDVHHEMQNIHDNLEKMHSRMMSSFPGPQPPIMQFDSIIPPPPMAPIPFPNSMTANMLTSGNMPHRNGSSSVLAIRNSPSPCGSLDRRRGMQMMLPGQHPVSFGPGEMPFGPRDMMIPPPPPMPKMTMPPPSMAPTPMITEDEYGNKIMELILDVKGFMPEDIHIHTEGRVLYVHARRLSAKHDVKNEGNVEDARVAKECRRQYTLPDIVRAENLSCFFNQKRQLTIEGALGLNIVKRTNKKKVKFVSGRK